MKNAAGQAPVEATPVNLSFGPATVAIADSPMQFNTVVTPIDGNGAKLILTVPYQSEPSVLRSLPAGVPVTLQYNKGAGSNYDRITGAVVNATEVAGVQVLLAKANVDGTGLLEYYSQASGFVSLPLTSLPAGLKTGEQGVSFWYIPAATPGGNATIIASTVKTS